MFFCVFAQKDSIYIEARLEENTNRIKVNQHIVYHNRFEKSLSEIKLLNWVAAYRKTETPLAERKLEDRKTDLYFAKKDEIGAISDLEVKIGNQTFTKIDTDWENIFLRLHQPLAKREAVHIELSYRLHLPDARFTGYGKSKEGFHLKYFFLVPDSFDDEQQIPKYYLDIEESQNVGSFWKIHFELPVNYYVQGNLPQTDSYGFEGVLHQDVEWHILPYKNTTIATEIDGKPIVTEFSYAITPAEKADLEFYLPLQLKFIKEKIGWLPDKIFISEKFRKKEDFFGKDDVKFWKFKFQLFSDAEKTDLDYFSIISQNVINQAIISDKIKDHWLENGLKTYLEIQYLKKNYQNHRLLGTLPSQMSLLGIKPLNWTNASKLKLTDRYGLAYQYIMTQNLDQKIAEPLYDLSNFNEMAISKFETGTLFNFVSEKIGTHQFDGFLKSFIQKNEGQVIDGSDFLEELVINSNSSADFLKEYMQHKNRTDFKLQSVTKKNGAFQIKVAKNTTQHIPFLLESQEKSGEKKSFWFDTHQEKTPTTYQLPIDEAEKITINDGYIFPESNFRNNYLYTKGFFANAKKIKFKLYNDIPNDEYNEVFVSPSLKYNAYDKLMFGLNLRNKSLFDRQFLYSFSPYYSSGTGSFTGSGGVSYSFRPAESFYRHLNVGMSASYFHYNFNLAYRKFAAFSSINFAKNPRSQISKNIGFSYEYVKKDLTETMIKNGDYGKYNLWNTYFSFSDNKAIHERYFNVVLQSMDDFQKINSEAFYRWEYAQNKKISFRMFGGYFLSNHTKNNTFNFGVSRLSNYAFSYGLLGQSATSGIFSQQYILAEGGFKSFFNTSVNQWIISANTDAHLWKMFNVYADAGVYKNKFRDPRFIWDSGVKLKLVPDFLEIYFPVQSSLGFEPSFKDYASRIRFTLNLNFGSLFNHFRRGWF